ncbi:hypothetical protein CDAR_197511 [Caerostris darwini]|uniref:Uncharacterized protein n=1 Tax=Caerostris darwini TaxID=1538125 RepID=A0AAV4WCQ3_9ARAC|nr:hypothetical protein CDAR_197511 [Caerostris darwini]
MLAVTSCSGNAHEYSNTESTPLTLVFLKQFSNVSGHSKMYPCITTQPGRTWPCSLKSFLFPTNMVPRRVWSSPPCLPLTSGSQRSKRMVKEVGSSMPYTKMAVQGKILHRLFTITVISKHAVDGESDLNMEGRSIFFEQNLVTFCIWRYSNSMFAEFVNQAVFANFWNSEHKDMYRESGLVTARHEVLKHCKL